MCFIFSSFYLPYNKHYRKKSTSDHQTAVGRVRKILDLKYALNLLVRIDSLQINVQMKVVVLSLLVLVSAEMECRTLDDGSGM